jgi:(R,R)-butanediol dehydrogenase / meso-butanediol dehydrogenase / diacetyl reductase
MTAEHMPVAVFYGAGDVRIETRSLPEPAEGEVLVRVAAVGICGTDAHEFSSGPHLFPIDVPHPVTGHVGPMVPGHEFSGTVVALGPSSDSFRPGDRVVSGSGISCGDCHWCQRRRTNLCERYSTVGLQRDGGLAGFVVVPERALVPLGVEDLDLDVAALGQPMSIAVHAMRRARVSAGDVAVILGAGGVGVFLAVALMDAGVTVVVSDLDSERLGIAAGLGVDHLHRAGQDRPLQAVLAELSLIPSAIFEVSGSASGLTTALMTATRGTRVVVVGFQSQPLELDVRDLTLREVELIGSNGHVVGDDLPEALRILRGRPGAWTAIAPVVLPLDRLVVDGLSPLAEGRSTRIKTLIDPWARQQRALGAPDRQELGR